MHPLWLCLRLPSLPLEALPLPGSGAAAVFERKRQRKLVVCVNAAAEAFGLAPGLELGAAAALAPDLSTFERNPRAERGALAALCATAYGFSSRVTAQPASPAPRMAALWLEIGTSLTLFGGLDTLTQKLRYAIESLGYTFSIGVAPTMEAAYLLAGKKAALALTDLWPALGGLALADLPVPEDTLAALAGSGLKKFGEVLALPIDALARRFSPDFTDWLGRVVGRVPEARRFYSPPEHYRRYFELLGEVETTEALRFPIRRLLAEFAAYLTARDTGAPSFTLELEHEGGAVRSTSADLNKQHAAAAVRSTSAGLNKQHAAAAVRSTSADLKKQHAAAAVRSTSADLENRIAAARWTLLEIGLASPGRDAVHFGVLVHTRLERLALPKPVRGIALSAKRFAPVSVRQFDLFATRGTEEHEWREVLDRLHARLGFAAVQGLGLHADHRPEKTVLRMPAAAQARVPGVAPNGARKERPLCAARVPAFNDNEGRPLCEARVPAFNDNEGRPLCEARVPAFNDNEGRPLCEARVPAFNDNEGRPLWLLPQPRELTAAPRCVRGPERIEGGWWDGGDVQRDYYVAEAGEGSRLWVFRDRSSGSWFLHGLWA